MDHEVPHFSISQLTMLNRCGKQYEFRYVKGLKIPPSWKQQSGKAIHQALEYNSKLKMTSGEDMPLEAIVQAASDAHDKMLDVELEEAMTPKALGQDKDQSIEIVKHYRTQHAPAITPLAVEYAFTIDLPEDDFAVPYIPVIGYVDSYAEVPDPRPGPTKGQRIIALEDYKKVDRRKSQLEIDISPQLTLYDYVYNLQTEGETTDVIGLRQLIFGGPRSDNPGPHAEPVYRDAKYLDPPMRKKRWGRVLGQLAHAQRTVQRGEFQPTDNPQNCSWCGYRSICQNALV